MSFGSDKRWVNAKKISGELDWVDIISYYRLTGGKNVFVYVIGDGDKKQIIDYVDHDNHDVILLNKRGDIEIDTYENVTNSRKMFEYSDTYEEVEYYINDTKILIPVAPREERGG